MLAAKKNVITAGKDEIVFLFHMMTVRVHKITVLLNEVIFLFHKMTVALDQVIEQQIFFANLNGKKDGPLVKVNVLTAGQNELILSHADPAA